MNRSTGPSAEIGRRAPPGERFFRFVKESKSGCWRWTGAIQSRGYGCFSIGSGKSTMAHRWSYEFHVGPIPNTLVIDHLCRNKRCVNPAHLEPVTSNENCRRAYDWTVAEARRKREARLERFAPGGAP